jgi:beta-aspartyl-peptidase (threonine type)
MTGPTRNASPGFTIAVHGGAGTLRRGLMDEARAALYHAGLRSALIAGRDILAAGGSALDAVTAAVAALEDDPLFNAGRAPASPPPAHWKWTRPSWRGASTAPARSRGSAGPKIRYWRRAQSWSIRRMCC